MTYRCLIDPGWLSTWRRLETFRCSTVNPSVPVGTVTVSLFTPDVDAAGAGRRPSGVHQRSPRKLMPSPSPRSTASEATTSAARLNARLNRLFAIAVEVRLGVLGAGGGGVLLQVDHDALEPD